MSMLPSKELARTEVSQSEVISMADEMLEIQDKWSANPLGRKPNYPDRISKAKSEGTDFSGVVTFFPVPIIGAVYAPILLDAGSVPEFIVAPIIGGAISLFASVCVASVIDLFMKDAFLGWLDINVFRRKRYKRIAKEDAEKGAELLKSYEKNVKKIKKVRKNLSKRAKVITDAYNKIEAQKELIFEQGCFKVVDSRVEPQRNERFLKIAKEIAVGTIESDKSQA